MTRKTYCGNLLWQSGLTLLVPAMRSARLPFDSSLRDSSSAHLKQLVKKIGQDKAMEMLKGAPL